LFAAIVYDIKHCNVFMCITILFNVKHIHNIKEVDTI